MTALHYGTEHASVARAQECGPEVWAAETKVSDVPVASRGEIQGSKQGLHRNVSVVSRCVVGEDVTVENERFTVTLLILPCSRVPS